MSKTILLVEDDEDDIFFFNEFLKETKLDADLVVAKTGSEAVAYEDELKKFDLIFLDINLPYIDGFECLRRFRSRDNTATIFMLSTSSSLMSLELAKSLGASGYFVKPITIKDYRCIMKNALSWINVEIF